MKSLIGFHHTGCDAISAFAGREKAIKVNVKIYKIC